MAQEIAELTHWSTTVKPLRPTATLTKHVTRVVDAISTAFDVTVRALGEERLAEAQRASEHLQAALDAAEAAVVKAGELLERVNKVDSAEDLIGGWLAEAVQGDINAAIARGHDLFAAATGDECGDESAFAATVYDTIAATIGDPEEFWKQVAGHRDVLLQAQSNLDAILRDPLYVSRSGDVTHDLWTHAQRAAVMPYPETLRQEASDILEVGHLVSEQAWKFHLGVACAATTRRSFTNTQATDVSDLAQVAIDKGWPVGDVTTAAIRNAFAHRDYVLDGEEVLLSAHHRAITGQPQLRMSLPEMLDAVLHTVEVGSAMELALSSVAEGRGLQSRVLPPAKFLAKALLVGQGWADIDITLESRVLRVHASVAGPVQYAIVGLIAFPFSGVADTILADLRRADTDEAVAVSLPAIAFERWDRADDTVTRDVEFLALLRETTRNGDPLASDDHVSKYVAVKACQAAVDRSRPSVEVSTELRAWRGLARRLGFDELALLLGRAQRWRISADAGIPVDTAEMTDLISAAETTVDPLPKSLL